MSQADAKKRNPGREDADDDEERGAKRRNLEASSSSSSADSSPVREPYVPVPGGRPKFFDDPKFFEAFYSEKAKVDAKLARQAKLPTLQYFADSPMFSDPNILPIRESGTKAVLSAAKFVLSLSSSLADKPLERCCGFWIDWNQANKTGIVLTTAHLIRSKDPPHNIWLGGEEYSPHANVIVHLLDNTSAEGQLLYYQPHYDIAFFRVKMDKSVQLPSFNDAVKCAQKVFQVGRDKSLNLKMTYGRVQYLNPSVYERYHYMYFDHEDEEYDDGAPIIDMDGKVVGMVNISTRGSFVPSSILLKCLDTWKQYEYIPRPHLGLTFWSIKLLEPAHAEMIWRTYNIDDGLIVQEVSKGSHAEKLGIRRGDIIECFNGERISTTVELENMLLSICKEPSVNQDDLNAEIHVSVGVFQTRKRRRKIGELIVNVSDRGEVVVRDTYVFTRGDVYASVSPSKDG